VPFPTRRAVLVLLAGVIACGPAAGAADLAVSLDAGWYDMTSAHRSAEAVFGSRGGPTVGGTVRLGLGRSWFAGAGARYFQRDGERVFTRGEGAPVFRLGHPLTVRLIPVYALAGYRFRSDARLVPYVSGGVGVAILREEDTVAEVSEVTASTRASGHLATGLEYGRGAVRLGAELMFTSVPGSAGIGGVSAAYRETDVGGFTLVGRIAFSP
jgi:hypothetical protein